MCSKGPGLSSLLPHRQQDEGPYALLCPTAVMLLWQQINTAFVGHGRKICSHLLIFVSYKDQMDVLRLYAFSLLLFLDGRKPQERLT